MHHRFALQFGGLVVRYVHFEKLTQQKSLLAEALGIFIVGEKIDQFIAEDCDTTWLQANDGNACANLRLQGLEDLTQQPLSSIEHALVIERTPAAQ